MSGKLNPAVEAARETNTDERVLDSGVCVRIHRIPQLLIDDAVNRVKAPTVPYVFDSEKGYEIPNENDPRYLAALEQHERDQSQAAVDAVILWGVELVGDMPKDEDWLPKLQFYAKRGRVDLSGFDFESKLEKEFVFKRYVALSAKELGELLPEMISGVTEEDVAKATESFRSN